MSKAFDKVWHEGLIFKLKQNGVTGKLLKLLVQRVVHNGVPQGSVLGPLLFLVYIIDLEKGIKSSIKVFADDTSLFSILRDFITSADGLNHDLGIISHWAFQWKMSFNPDPTKLYFISSKRCWCHQISFIVYTGKTLDQIYKMYVRPHLDFCDVMYHIPKISNLFDSSFRLLNLMGQIESAQYQAALAVTGTWNQYKIYEEFRWESLSDRRTFRRLIQFFKIQNGFTPEYLKTPVPVPRNHLFGTRSENGLTILNAEQTHT